MHSFLRIFQITLIITQITTVKGSPSSTVSIDSVRSTNTSNVSVTSSTNAAQPNVTSTVLTLIASPRSSVTARSNETSNVSVTSSTTAAQPNVTSTVLTVIASPSSGVPARSNETLKTSNVSSSVPVTASTELSTKATNVPDTSTITIDVAATSSEPVAQTSGTSAELPPSSSQKSNVTARASEPLKTNSVSGNATPTKPPTTSVPVGASTKTNFSHPGPFPRQTQSVTANYSLSSASRRGSIALTTAEPKATRSSFIVQTLTTSLPVSVNWTDWSVDSDHCQQYCSEKGGTVTASRQCYSHAVTLAEKVCTKHNTSTMVVKCDERYCPLSGKEAFRSSISTLAVSILLIMLSSTFVRG